MPNVVDCRDGLTAEVLAGLRAAQRASLAVKGPTTAALGYWVDDELTVALVHCASHTLMRVPQMTIAPPVGPQLVRAPQPKLEGVLLDVRNARDNPFWDRLTAVLRVGDIVRITGEHGHTVLSIRANGATIATLRLPRSAAAGQSAA